ncbi:nucleotidyltransferase domain-containing protein [Sutcliffiella rhizosphaerae]|uniref:Nucleotidyl transferase AbiEii/AbiGii toxin family protein n=1 Tax=Sutcliffiella rhizosphaerae TaxID=2880967 RepID=A0ABM8YT90_9BACI|nr:hypothetical protein [Sutcliffiella rhizosphaerae]CAG9623228.1 hypothetical protein BACCIP111883_04024 [Sutcliffiella rhizosphaerae]
MIDSLTMIGSRINREKITWAVGGSLLLCFHGLIEDPNDIDLLVDEKDATRLNQLLAAFGTEKVAISKDPFRTRYFSKFAINHADYDIMGGFAIEHKEGVYKFSFTEESVVESKTVNGIDIPLCALEDWYILYSLIPGKEEKATLLENHFITTGIKNSNLLANALDQPLPSEVKDRVVKLLS